MEYLLQFYAIYGSVINFIGINALLALSLNVTLSAGMLSLGNAAFAALGGYTAGILSLHFKLPYVVSLAGGTCTAGFVGLIIGLPVLRLRGVFLAMATLAFGEVVRLAAVNLDITGGAEGLTGIPNVTTTWMIYLVLAGAAYFIAVLRRSRLGWGLVSMREDETAAGSLGIHITYYKVVAFVIGAMIAGLAGGMYAHLNYLITPRDFGFFIAVDLLIYNIVGGTGVWYGPILGAAMLTALPEVLRGVGVTAGPIRMGINGTYSAPGNSLSSQRLGLALLKESDRRTVRDGGRMNRLVIESISRNFGGVQALDDVSFVVEPGTIHGLIGPNGAGKTTLINILSGLLPPSTGRMSYKNYDLHRLAVHQMAAIGIARTFQNIRLFPHLSCLENVQAGQHLTSRRSLLPRLLQLPSARREDRRLYERAMETLGRVGLDRQGLLPVPQPVVR